jgi:hypothetical protein
MRKRRAFGPRRGNPWVVIRNYGPRASAILRQGSIGMVEAMRFITWPRRDGKSTFAEQWKLATVAAEVAGRLYEDTTPAQIAESAREFTERYERAMYEVIKKGSVLLTETGIVKREDWDALTPPKEPPE